MNTTSGGKVGGAGTCVHHSEICISALLGENKKLCAIWGNSKTNWILHQTLREKREKEFIFNHEKGHKSLEAERISFCFQISAFTSWLASNFQLLTSTKLFSFLLQVPFFRPKMVKIPASNFSAALGWGNIKTVETVSELWSAQKCDLWR